MTQNLARRERKLYNSVGEDASYMRGLCDTQMPSDEFEKLDSRIERMFKENERSMMKLYGFLYFKSLNAVVRYIDLINNFLAPLTDAFYLDGRLPHLNVYHVLFMGIAMRKHNPIPPAFKMRGLLNDLKPIVQGDADEIVNEKIDYLSKKIKVIDDNNICREYG